MTLPIIGLFSDGKVEPWNLDAEVDALWHSDRTVDKEILHTA